MDFRPIEGAAGARGLTYLDHLTHNVLRGNMASGAEYYERIFNFREIRYFDIEGKMTGLVSKAMTSPCGKIRIPINESQDDKSQIEEYLRDYRGEGIQHIALARRTFTDGGSLRARGVAFQATLETYYEGVDASVPAMATCRGIAQAPHPDRWHGATAGSAAADLTPSDRTDFLRDHSAQRQRGFGEGNFKALFESIELDQIRRGVI